MSTFPILLDGHSRDDAYTCRAVESSSISHSAFDSHGRAAGGPTLDGHRGVDNHTSRAVESSSASHRLGDSQWPNAGGSLLDGHTGCESQAPLAVETPSAIQDAREAQAVNDGGTSPIDHDPGSAHILFVDGSSSLSHRSSDTQIAGAEGTISDHAANDFSLPNGRARRSPILSSGYLMLLSDSLDDLEGLRIATANRLRALTRDEADSDGEYRGLGLDNRSPEVATASALLESLEGLEHQATLALQRELRRSPLFGWVKRSKGIGAKQAARLIAVIGDPYWNSLHDRPRTVSELWAYCGYAVFDGHAQRRRKGQASNWSDTAKSRAFLMAQSCVKAVGGEYRATYDAARARYADSVHPHDCVRCGPAGKPALVGTPLSLGHQHARALRVVAKTILRDLWIEARTIHEGHAA